MSLSIGEEIIELSNTLALAQSQLLQLTKRVEQQDQETANWKSRYEDLDVAYKWLKVQNAELKRKMVSHKPEVNNVLSARENALRHARKVIRDLIDERGNVNSAGTSGSIREEDVDQALDEEFSQHSEDLPLTDSDKTVRLAAAPQNGTNPSTSQLAQVSEGTVGAQSRNALADSLDVEPEHSMASPLLQATQISTQTSEEQPQNTSKGHVWQIHYGNPPGSSVVTDGPLSPSTLEKDLSMDDYMRVSLQSLAESSDFSMRFQVLHLHSNQNVACLYDPIFIETREQSYILDWGRLQTNENMRQYIMGNKDIDPVFHTFTFPLNEKGWFYIGAQHWSVVDFETIWPLEGKSRKAIIKKLFKRSQGKVSKREIARLLDSGELVQFCVELTAVTDTRVSQDFSRDVLGYRTPPRPT